MTRKNQLFWLLMLPDLGLLFVALFLAFRVRYGVYADAAVWSAHVSAFSWLFILWVAVYFIHGLFESPGLRRYTSLFSGLLSATVVNGILSVAYFYLQPDLILTPRRFLLWVLAFSFLLTLVWHLLVKNFIKGRLVQGIYLLPLGQQMEDLALSIEANSYLGIRLMGRLSSQDLNSPPISRDSIIVLPDNLREDQSVLERLYDLRTQGVIFVNHRDFYEQLLRKIYVSDLDKTWFLENIDYSHSRAYALVKRLTDLLAGLVGLLVFVVTWPLLALLIKISSSGPVLFVQPRTGQGGKIFNVYKYRTMSGGPTNTWTQVNDPRITPIGKFFRKSRLDELPQCINLLLGNMSLVGPRPEQPHIVEKLKHEIPFYNERHMVKPGLTGWAQLNIYAGSLEESRLKLQYDLYYVKHRGILFDLEIIFKTIYYIFTWQGR